jgi:hypothetical protein
MSNATEKKIWIYSDLEGGTYDITGFREGVLVEFFHDIYPKPTKTEISRAVRNRFPAHEYGETKIVWCSEFHD